MPRLPILDTPEDTLIRWKRELENILGNIDNIGGYNPAVLSAALAQAVADGAQADISALAPAGLIEAAKLGTTIIDGGYIKSSLLTADNILVGTLAAALIAANTITTEMINANAITADKMAVGTITASSGIISDAAITSAKIEDAAITSAKIADATIVNGDIANATITGAKIANATIDTANIALGAITTALIDTAAIGTTQIADGSITDAKIVSLTANKLSAGTIDAGVITVNNLVAENITTGTLNGERLADDTIINRMIADGAVKNENVFAETITGDRLVADAITAREIASATVTTNEIAANTITAANIAAGTITATEMAAGTITAASGIIADAAITSAKIANATITDANIDSLSASKITAGTLTAGTLGGERVEIAPAGGSSMKGYDSSNNLRTEYKSDKIVFYDDVGNPSETMSATTGNKTITVGSGKNFATIQAAIDSLPSIINHTITISVYSGTYDEAVAVRRFSGDGSLTIEEAASNTATIRSLQVTKTKVNVTIKDFTFSSTSTAIYIIDCLSVTLIGLSITAVANSLPAINVSSCLDFLLNSCVVSNRLFAVTITGGSTATIYELSGTGNTVAINSTGSVVCLREDGNGNTIAGRYTTDYGGVIVPGTGINPNRLLWSGSWSSGNITVPGSSGYTVFLILSSSTFGFLVWRVGGVLHGGYVYDNDTNHVSHSFKASTSGDVWIYSVKSAMTHVSASNHQARSTTAAPTVTAIYGII